jgi:hypothetical protein
MAQCGIALGKKRSVLLEYDERTRSKGALTQELDHESKKKKNEPIKDYTVAIDR